MFRKIIFSFSLASFSLVSVATDYYIVGGTNLDAVDKSSISGEDGATGWSTTEGGSKTIDGITEANACYHIWTDRKVRSPAKKDKKDYATPSTSTIVIEPSCTWTILDKMQNHSLTLSNLVIRTGGQLVVTPIADGFGTFKNTYAGNWELEEGSSVVISAAMIKDDKNLITTKNFDLAADISGRGAIAMPSSADPVSGTLSNKITGNLSGFAGDIMTWNGYNAVSLELVNEMSIPGNPAESEVAYVVVTNGATLKISHDWISPKNRIWIFGDAGRPTIEVASGKTVEINGDLIGSVGFVKTGDGTLVLRGASKDFSGNITISAGTLCFADEGARLLGVPGVTITENGGKRSFAGVCVATISEQIVYSPIPFENGVEPPVIVSDLNHDDGRELTLGTDYTVRYENNTTYGLATAVVTGIGNYEGVVREMPFVVHSVKKIEEKYTLLQDEDWSNYEYVSLPSKNISVIELNGKELKITGLVGRGTIEDSIGGGKLHYYVHDTYASGYVAKFGSGEDFVTLQGKLTLVKEGPGVLLCNKAGQSYTGGTVVDGGVLKYGCSDKNIDNQCPFGAKSANSPITINKFGILDPAGSMGWGNHYIVFNGGTVSNTVAVNNITYGVFNPHIKVNADFTFVTMENYGWAVGELGGHAATVYIAGSKYLYIQSHPSEPPTSGRFNVMHGGYLATIDPSYKRPTAFRYVDFVNCNAALNLLSEMSVGDYAPCNTVTTSGGSAELKVSGTFTPNSDYFYGPTMQDGSTIDLSAKTETWNAKSKLTGGNSETKFADGAKVTIELGDRKLKKGDKVIAWESKPNASFVSKKRCIFDVLDDGLYVQSINSGFSILVR